MGLKAIRRWVWAPKGTRPMAVVREDYEWLYVYGFVRPSTGDTHWVLLPRVNSEAFSLALADFAKAVGAGPQKHILVALDQAGWHLSQDVRIPPGIELVPLPSHSPELQPAEQFWRLANEPLANRSFASIEELDAVVGERCVTLSNMPELIHSYTKYHWWPDAA